MNELAMLFERVSKLNYPSSMKMIIGEIERIAFFPGGKGTFDKSDSISDKKIMVIGQDFDCANNLPKYQQQSDDEIRKNATWRNLLAFLGEVNIKPSDCFFTNAIMGARSTGKSTGISPGFKDKPFIESCRDFFLFQLGIQKPSAIFVLGRFTAQFMSGTSTELTTWKRIENFKQLDANNESVKKEVVFYNGTKSNIVLLLHPSFRNVNIHNRSFSNYKGHKAEIEMVKYILS